MATKGKKYLTDSVKEVHKAIVCPRSPFFSHMVKPGQDAEDGVIALHKDEPHIIRLMLQYLYWGDYHPDEPEPQRKQPTFRFPHTCMYGDDEAVSCDSVVCHCHACGRDCDSTCRKFTCDLCPDEILDHANVYEIAEKYKVWGLKELAATKFGRACKTYWSHPNFAIAARIAFESTPDHDKGLRDLVAKTIHEHMSKLLGQRDIGALMMEFNGLAFGLLKLKVKD